MFLFQAAALTSDQGSTIQNLFTSFTSSPFVHRVYLDLKIITIVYAAIVFIAIILVIITARPRKIIKQARERLEEALGEERERQPAEYGGGKWQEILKMLEGKEESSWKLAVIEADKFFDDIMQRLGYSGENFGERLKQVHATEVGNLDSIWEAHRVRNSISHDMEFKLSQDKARKAVGAYERAMRDLDVM